MESDLTCYFYENKKEHSYLYFSLLHVYFLFLSDWTIIGWIILRQENTESVCPPTSKKNWVNTLIYAEKSNSVLNSMMQMCAFFLFETFHFTDSLVMPSCTYHAMSLFLCTIYFGAMILKQHIKHPVLEFVFPLPSSWARLVLPLGYDIKLCHDCTWQLQKVNHQMGLREPRSGIKCMKKNYWSQTKCCWFVFLNTERLYLDGEAVIQGDEDPGEKTGIVLLW